MKLNRETIYAEALSLSESERAQLIQQLVESLSAPIDPDIESAWAAEAQRRIEAYDRGELEAIDGEPILRALVSGKRP